MVITSRQNDLIKETIKLKQKKYRQERGLFLVEGQKLISECIKAGYQIENLFISGQDKSIMGDFQVNEVSQSVLSSLSSFETPQNMIAVCKFKDKKDKTYNGGNFLVLDRLQNPQNVGAIIRSALGANFNTIFLIDCADVYDIKTIRASMGAVFHTNIFCVTENYLIENFSNKLITADMKGENIYKTTFSGDVGLIIGNEGQGVSENLKRASNKLISIPMNENLESLNASVSASLIMYAISLKLKMLED